LNWGKVRYIPEWWKTGNEKDSSLIIAREDKEDLTMQQVEALILYTDSLMPEIKQLHYERPPTATKNETNVVQVPATIRQARELFISQHMNSKAFNKFFEKVKQEKLAAGDLSWADSTPPQPSKATVSQAEGDGPASQKGSKEAQIQNTAGSQKFQGGEKGSGTAPSGKRKRDS
jgi:hypothetical protein